MMYEVDSVASGEGWSIHHDRGDLFLVVAEGLSLTPRGGAKIQLPETFVQDFLKQKKQIRAGDERAYEEREARPIPPPKPLFVLETGLAGDGPDHSWFFSKPEIALDAAKRLMAQLLPELQAAAAEAYAPSDEPVKWLEDPKDTLPDGTLHLWWGKIYFVKIRKTTLDTYGESQPDVDAL